MRALIGYSKFLDIIEKILRAILIVLLSSMVLIMFYQVIMRYVFSDAQPWCEELTLYLGVYCVFLGISIATRRESHLQVDFLMKLYSPRIRCLATAICSVIAILVMVVFCLYAISLCQYATGKSTTLPIEMKQIYYAFPVGSILVILFSVENIYRNFLGFLHNGELPLLKGGNKL